MPELLNVRDRFPLLKTANYLDTAAAGLTAPGVGAAVAYYLDVVKGRGILGREEWRGHADKLRARLGKLLGVAPADIDFFSNTSEGINLVAHSMTWRAGDNVVVAADEYPAVREAWHVARSQGVEIIQVPVTDESRREQALLSAITPRTRVLAVSQVHWVTGTCIDTGRMGKACRERDALLVVDGVQALGCVPVNLADVDVYSAAHFKWLLSGFGSALFTTSERARSQLQPAFRGAMNALDPKAEVRQLQYGHPNYSGVYALSAALDFFDSCGWDAVHEKCRFLSQRLAAGLQRTGFQLMAPAERLANIVSFKSPQADAVARALATRAIHVTGRGPAVRVSPHFYNDASDIDALLDALPHVANP